MINHLSYSSISTYLLCPRAWRYRYLDKVKTPVAAVLPFGSAFHDAVEEYVLSGFAGSAERPVDEMFRDAWARQLERDQEIDWGKDSAEKLAALGAKMCGGPIEVTGGGPSRSVRNLSIFLNDLQPLIVDEVPVIEKRVEFTVPGVPVPIVGYIDMISSDGVPVDFKTSSRAWYAKKAHGELQPAFYLLALLQAGIAAPDGRFRYIVVTKTKKPKVQVIDTKRTIGQLFWLMEQIREVWEGIKAQVFPPNSLTWKCPGYCEFSEMCLG